MNNRVLNGLRFVYNETTKDDTLTSFSRTEPYNESIQTIAAVASAVKEGYSLTPADVVIMIDQEFTAANVQQCTGRVRRATLKQKAPFTESYRLISTAPWANIQTFMVLRHEKAMEFKFMMTRNAPAADGASDDDGLDPNELMSVDEAVASV